ncbi:MAG TPA: class I SAM-dependent methyltransferase, partial [Ilumatobacteraceae bacterium]|nr:class I SAM-dependent methyltransferase [Ilumatobacteraceae bacterium]
ALDGVADKLAAGAVVADVGCGAGSAVMLLADAFPASTYTGYDISQHALTLARQRAVGCANVAFVDPRQQPLPDDHSVDVLFTFDCLHDMTHPQEMVDAIASALKPDGTWLLVDVKALDTFEENIAKNPMASLMYGISVLHCMSSAMSAPDGAGLGTLGLPESKAREMATAAGLTRFRKLDIDHGANFFYEIRP